MSRLSVVIPTLNEAARLPALLNLLQADPADPEIIVVDGGSADGTPELARSLGVRVLTGAQGRGPQLRLGAEAATGDVLWFLHADCRPAPGSCGAILDGLAANPAAPGGNFQLHFDGADGFSAWLDGFYGWLRRRGIYYGDSGIFVRRTVLDAIGGVPDLLLLEDLMLARRLQKAGPTLCIADPPLITSARRFQGRHPVEIVSGWLAIHALFYARAPQRQLAWLYDNARRRQRRRTSRTPDTA